MVGAELDLAIKAQAATTAAQDLFQMLSPTVTGKKIALRSLYKGTQSRQL